MPKKPLGRSTESLGVIERQRLETSELGNMSHGDVLDLANELPSGSVETIERAVRFVCGESEGVWHGRGRAMMCRRMKHVELAGAHSDRLVTVILERLASGDFSEQFRDQLRLAIHLNREKAFSVANRALSSEREYVRRYARWVLSHQEGANDA